MADFDPLSAPKKDAMELSYGEYLDALRVTKGTFGWQMLFVDASLVSRLEARL